MKDADEAQAFWGGLFGWEFGSPMAEMDYRMAQIDEKSGAAIFAADDPKHHPNVYLATDDIDASIAKARELGGTAEDKSPVPGVRLVLRLHGQPGNPLPSLAGRQRRRLTPSGRPDRGAAPRLR